MKRVFAGMILVLASLGAGAAQEVDALGKCLGDSTTGRERKDLAKWMFLAMASHPEIKPLAQATPKYFDQASQATAAVFTRLIAESCVNEVRAAISVGGPVAVQLGFQVLGQLAMQELMTNQDVQRSIGAFERFIDQKRVSAALERQ